MRTDFIESLAEARLLAIIRADDPSAARAAATTLMDAGFTHLEVSLNSAGALHVIGDLVREAPDGAWIGAGTVITADDARRAQDAGAAFAVTPAIAGGVAECARLGLPVLAGALTPSEAVAGMEYGAAGIKLFPASLGGPAYLAALRDPLPRVPFVPVGGVTAEQAGEYLAAGAVAVGLGSPLLGDAARGGSLSGLRERAARFLTVAGATGRGR